MNSKEKIKDILDWTEGWANIDWGYKALLKLELEELVEIAKAEKQVPVKPIYGDYDDDGYDNIIPNEARCPMCGYEFEFGTWNDEDNHHCVCGQKMDWSE